MTTPFDNLIEWFGQLPSKYRQDLASEIAMLMPGIDVNPYHRKFLDDFMEQLDVFRRKGVHKEYGLLLCLKVLIDDIITVKNRENANLEKEKNELEELVNMTGSCSFATAASEKAMQYSEWKAIAEQWNGLTRQLLTPDSIDLWRQSVSPSGHMA